MPSLDNIELIIFCFVQVLGTDREPENLPEEGYVHRGLSPGARDMRSGGVQPWGALYVIWERRTWLMMRRLWTGRAGERARWRISLRILEVTEVR